MNVVIVPSHNQSKHIKSIIQGYEDQTIGVDLLLFVLDRCDDDSEEVLKSTKTLLNVEYVVKTIGEKFSAGMTRDFGVDFIQKHYPNYELLIFTDGDCIPSPKLVELHLENIRNSDRAIVSCGRRIMENESGEFLDDERKDPRWVNEFSFTDKNGRLIISNQLTLLNIVTYSCNFAFNKQAIELCQKINQKISGISRVFSNFFDGSWGNEDCFISHCLYRTGNYIVLTSNDCFVTHYWHPESNKTGLDKKKMLLIRMSELLERLIVNGEIEGPVQTIIQKNRIFFGKSDLLNSIKNVDEIMNVDPYLDSVFESVSNQTGISKIMFNYLTAKNVRFSNVTSNLNLHKIENVSYVKELLGYLKFYLIDGKIEFVDDVKDFKKINSSDSNCTYCKLNKIL